MMYNQHADTVSVFIADREGNAMIKGTPELIAGRREEILNACEKLCDRFICKTLATRADEAVLNEQGKIDCRTFKPVLFEFPTYAYFVTGERIGSCGKMN